MNPTEDPAICDELIERLSELRGFWAALANGPVQRSPRGHDGARRGPAATGAAEMGAGLKVTA